MPVYLFTYHAYGTWLPDRGQGYVRRHEGVLPANDAAAKMYRDQMKQDRVTLGDQAQRKVIDAVCGTQPHIEIVIRMVATDPTHIHVLVQWTHRDAWKKMRQSIKTAVSIALKKHKDQKWLSGGASGKHVKDEAHLCHLEKTYLPSHRGWKWSQEKGLFK